MAKHTLSSILGCFSEEKTEECDQRNQSLSDKFRRLMPDSDTYFLVVSARVSLKVATKDYFRDKETMKKRSSTTKKIEISSINLECSWQVQKHFFWN